MREILKTTPPQLIALLTICLGLIAYGLYISKIAERKCIKGAGGEVAPQEIINWCKNTF